MKGNLDIALRSLRQNRMQTSLTLVGMGVGVAMVVVVSGLGLGAQLRIEDQIESAGPTQIILRSGNYRPASIEMSGQQDSGGGEPSEGSVSMGMDGGEVSLVTSDEAVAHARRRTVQATAPKIHRTPSTPLDPKHAAMLDRLEGVRTVTASIQGNVSVEPSPITAMRTVRLEGADISLPEISNWDLSSGRLPTEAEFRTGAPVMVASADVVERIWPDAKAPLGLGLPIKGRHLKLVGILARKTADTPAGAVPLVYLPLPLAQSLLERQDYDSIAVRTSSVGVTTRVATDMRVQLRELHSLQPDELDDFRIETQSVAAMPGMGTDPRLMRAVHSNVIEFEQASWEEMARSLRRANRTFTLLLAAAAAVSLIVGGIGVMNIMLVSVTSRTREIGLRMALGARQRDVMAQFLVEACLLAVVGGAMGVAIGTAGLGVARYGLHWSTAISPVMLIAALVMAAGTGIVFGYGPAKRAAVLDPVVATRSE